MEVEEIELKITLPDDGIGMVIMQPFVELCKHEPYRWQNDKKSKQIERIIKTLKIAKQVDHGCEKTHFTIFPEYSIPGLEGIAGIERILKENSWKDGTIIIGGVDGLNKSEYSTLCSEDNTEVHHENKPVKVRDDQWINCCITWVKGTNGTLKRWIQPKLSPSWPERNITDSQMFAGRSVFVFSGKFENKTDFRFLSLICFDWIGPIGTSYGIWAVLSKINNSWLNTKKEMNLIFVLQFNSEPNHHNFLENARNYFEIRTRYPFVDRNEGIVLFANTAGGPLPGIYQSYGYSSLISSPIAPYDNKGCPPTFAVFTKKLRGTDAIGRCKEALFREMGACVHSFRFRFPSFVNLGPVDRCFPIDEAIVYPIDDGIDDPRTPSKPVPASVKWVNDQLDRIAPVLENEHPLKENIARAHKGVSDEIRRQQAQILCRYIEIASFKFEKEKDKWIKIEGRKIHNVDNWDENERKALEIVVYSLSIMKAWKPLEVSNSPAHATLKIQDKIIDVIVVFGKDHTKCYEYAEHEYSVSGQRFVIVVTHDGRSSLSEKHRDSIYDVKYDGSRGPNIADPGSRFYHFGYQNLIDACFHSQSLEELDGKLSEIMGV